MIQWPYPHKNGWWQYRAELSITLKMCTINLKINIQCRHSRRRCRSVQFLLYSICEIDKSWNWRMNEEKHTQNHSKYLKNRTKDTMSWNNGRFVPKLFIKIDVFVWFFFCSFTFLFFFSLSSIYLLHRCRRHLFLFRHFHSNFLICLLIVLFQWHD